MTGETEITLKVCILALLTHGEGQIKLGFAPIWLPVFTHTLPQPGVTILTCCPASA